MQRLGVFVAHGAHHALGQAEGEHAHQQPLGEVQAKGHATTRERLHHLGMVGGNSVHNVGVTTAGRKDAAGQHHNAHDHGNAAQGVGESHAAKAADGGKQDAGNAENG